MLIFSILDKMQVFVCILLLMEIVCWKTQTHVWKPKTKWKSAFNPLHDSPLIIHWAYLVATLLKYQQTALIQNCGDIFTRKNEKSRNHSTWIVKVTHSCKFMIRITCKTLDMEVASCFPFSRFNCRWSSI